MSKKNKRKVNLRLGTFAFLIVSFASTITACKMDEKAQGDPLVTGSVQNAPQEGGGSLRDAAEAARLWEADSGNIRKGFTYVRALLDLGQEEKVVEVLETLDKKNPNNHVLKAYFGKVLLQLGRFNEAEAHLSSVISSGTADWRVYSALGSAQDQLGAYKKARASYHQALDLNPDEPSVYNNLAMSYALEGNLSRAEVTLRRALTTNKGEKDERLRQNLALVVGLQGRLNEARQIASKDLPPDQVATNIAYLESLLAQKDTWSSLKGDRSEEHKNKIDKP